MARDERDAFGRELEAALRAREAVGAEYDDAFVDAFVERVHGEVARQVRSEVRRRRGEDKHRRYPVALAYTSLALGVPITGLAGWTADVEGIIASWCGIVAVNAIAATRGLRRRRD